MLFTLFVVLAVVAVACAADSAVAQVQAELPHVEGFGQRAAQAIFAGVVLQHPGKAANKKVQSGGYDLFDRSKIINEKLYVTRNRPNGDCSGPVIEEAAWIMDQCNFRKYEVDRRLTASDKDTEAVGGYSIKHFGISLSCSTEDDVVSLTTNLYRSSSETIYDSTTCNIGNLDDTNLEEIDACATEEEYAPYTGLRMKGAHCGTFPQEMDTVREGLYTLYYNTPECDSTPAGYKFAPFGVCQLFIDYQNSATVGVPDNNTKYYYITMDGFDAENDLVLVHGHSDPQCTKRLFKSHFDLNTHPLYDTCGFDWRENLAAAMFHGTTMFCAEEP